MDETSWAAAYPQYLQLLSVGFLWITLHCAGMCGPIVVGLDLGGALGRSRAPGGPWVGSVLLNLVLYQVGRCVTYGILGALAGWGGQVLQELFRRISGIAGLVVAAALLLAGLSGLLGLERSWLTGSGRPGNVLIVLVKRVQGLGGRVRPLLLGVVLGFLPCMIPLWVLGLSASTQSPLHGALLMIVLVWMTSIVIFGFGLAPAVLARRGGTLRQRLLPALLLLSGVWMGLIAAGANGWIDHASVGFSLSGRGYTIMFW
jgi:uncharacterized protein